MATWISLVVLSLAVVITLSFPRPGAEYKIPKVGFGPRSQYYILHSDGTYKYGHDTGDGAYERAMAQEPGRVTGAFGYKDSSGANINLEYTADDRGFIASGSHLPVAPEVPVIIPAASSRPSPATYSAAPVSSSAGGYSAPSTAGSYSSASASDASYSFNYDAGDSSRSESADSNLNVQGSYSFVPADNPNRLTVNYRAGSGIGFVAEGAHLPVAPEVPTGFGTSASVPAVRSKPAPSGYSATPSVYSAAPAHVAAPSAPVEVARVRSSVNDDGSYSFNYDTSSSSRAESGNAQNFVDGRFSFVADDGIDRSIQYTAGAETGFIADGAHLPIGPSVPGAESGVPTGRIFPILSEEEANALAASGGSGAPASTAGGYSAPGTAGGYSAPGTAGGYSAPGTAGGYSAPGTAASTAGGYSAPGTAANSFSDSASDASYSFNYDAGDSSRSESADSNLNVQGSYSFVPADSPNRLTVNYRAGSGIGFVAEGAHLPVAPEVPTGFRASASVPAVRSKPAPSGYSAAPSVYSAAPAHAAAASAPVEVARVRSSANDDGSYRFNYDTSSSSRAESGNAQNFVDGRFSFVADDGIDRSIQYTAGAETGFIADGAHLPIGPSVPGAESGVPTGRIFPILSEEEANALAASGGSGAPASTAGGYSAPGTAVSTAGGYSAPGTAASSFSASASDPSYSFNYDAGDSSRSESADSNLNVQGSYSFVPADSPNRLTVNYRAGSGIGFVAEGAHLPVAPGVPTGFGASASVPAVRSKPAPSGYSAAPSVYSAAPAPAVHSHVAASSSPGLSSSSGQLIGGVLLHQYAATNSDKFGYAFTAVDH